MTELSNQEPSRRSHYTGTALPMSTSYSPARPKRPLPPRFSGPEHPMWTGSEANVPTGTMFGHWRVLSSAFIRARGVKRLNCLCTSCGTEHSVAFDTLRNGQSTQCAACGVKQSRKTRDVKKWGRELDANDKVLQQRWNAIVHRCCNPKSRYYPAYGGRGILLSEEFKNDVVFVNYVKSLPDCPHHITNEHTIDRINVNGHYERGNLRFASQKEQMRNLQTTTYLEFDGEVWDSRSFCERFCKNYRPHVVARLVKKGMPPEQIIYRDQNSKHVGRRWGRTCV